jgi:hypothetical protein
MDCIENDASNNSCVAYIFVGMGTCILSHCLAIIGRIHVQTNREGRLTTEELLQVVSSLWSNPKFNKEHNL